ncbi:FAD-dependent oxidoreductase [Paenibacillus sp. ACRRX]|uniref:FAD-dependent oxidoreductase n=1 Tax=unclassified Paenibacillus TaxID=185978 RepID=UPI001EF56A85|nr:MULTISPECIES: FAD-dependent oxidoreductase [unclassified Paenibacillus]MCG7406245.1 FAD-dependent oxidoreductase [Paenibacillus sp. ACRRX]MDK8179278.1 FAD-dependent oxidoreductase [Paenibacillus sp. UMB4589-SE434]
MLDVVIIGAGPAGGSAALFTAKAGKQTVIIDNDSGLTKRAWIANQYGVRETSGPELLKVGQEQAAKFGALLVRDKAIAVDSSSEGVIVRTESGQTYVTKHVIIAAGFGIDIAEASGIRTVPGTEPRVKTIIDVDIEGRSSMEHVWAAGTIAGVSMHTIITAGDGAKVAINVISELNGTRYVDHDVIKA